MKSFEKIPHTGDKAADADADADSSTNTTVGGQKFSKNLTFLKMEKITKNAKLQNVYKYAKISNMLFDQRSLIHR